MRALLIILSLCIPAFAGEMALTVGLHTSHFYWGFDEAPNNDNELVSLRYNNIEFSQFQNSFHAQSQSLSYRSEYRFGYVGFTGRAGIVSGYVADKFSFPLPCYRDVCGFVAPGVSFHPAPNLVVESVVFASAVITGISLTHRW